MKKTFLVLFLGILIFNQKVYSLSVRNNFKNEIKPTIESIKEEIKPTVAAIREQTREEIKERLNEATTSTERNEIRNKIREENKGLLDQIKNQVREKLQNLKFSARIEGKITSLSSNSINIEDNSGNVYTINITEKTQLRRRFWGKAQLSEFAVGNIVMVIGQYINEEKKIIEAVLIRNLSIQKRWGVFFGQVLTSSQDQLTIKTLNRGELTVYYNKNTKLINREEKPISWQEIIADHRVRVKGVWDKDLKEIREVEEIKDFSLPIKTTVTITP